MKIHEGDLIAKPGEVAPPCKLWHGTRDRKGYGILTISGISLKAHRVAYRLHIGKIPAGMLVCHKCDNPPCVESSHLFVGTASDNQRDAVVKKRHSESRKTHCPQGHQYSNTNTRINKGKRQCRRCDRYRKIASRAYEKVAA